MLNHTQALSEATLNDYFKSLKKMEAYSKKFDSTRLPIVKFTESIRSSVERAPAWTRQMIINIEAAVDAHIRSQHDEREYDYTIDIIYEETAGVPNIGGNLGAYFYPRIPDQQCFLDIVKTGWDSKVTSFEKHNISRVHTELFHNSPEGFELTPVGTARHQIFTCTGFKAFFDHPTTNENLPIKKAAAKFLENSLQLFLTVISGSFDYVEVNQVKFFKRKDNFSYEIIGNPEYKFPWGEGKIQRKPDGTVL